MILFRVQLFFFSDWSFESIFQRKVNRRCPAALISQITWHEPSSIGEKEVYVYGAEGTFRMDIREESAVKTMNLPKTLSEYLHVDLRKYH
jgi:hypothetical protein